jgi:hypothetical protein
MRIILLGLAISCILLSLLSTHTWWMVIVVASQLALVGIVDWQRRALMTRMPSLSHRHNHLHRTILDLTRQNQRLYEITESLQPDMDRVQAIQQQITPMMMLETSATNDPQTASKSLEPLIKLVADYKNIQSDMRDSLRIQITKQLLEVVLLSSEPHSNNNNKKIIPLQQDLELTGPDIERIIRCLQSVSPAVQVNERRIRDVLQVHPARSSSLSSWMAIIQILRELYHEPENNNHAYSSKPFFFMHNNNHHDHENHPSSSTRTLFTFHTQTLLTYAEVDDKKSTTTLSDFLSLYSV